MEHKAVPVNLYSLTARRARSAGESQSAEETERDPRKAYEYIAGIVAPLIGGLLDFRPSSADAEKSTSTRLFSSALSLSSSSLVSTAHSAGRTRAHGGASQVRSPCERPRLVLRARQRGRLDGRRRGGASKEASEQGRAGELDKLLLTLTSRTAFAGRGKGKRTRAEEDEDESTAGEASDESDSPKKKKKPRKKRAKKSHDDQKKKKKKRGKQGKLETIQMLPLEMLSEVSRRRPPPS